MPDPQDREPWAHHGLQKDEGPKAACSFAKLVYSWPDRTKEDKKCVQREGSAAVEAKQGICF